jgi:Protein of unknown function (DUF1376)
LTDPLVPADTDLRDFQYMPLDVVRLVDSDLAALATGEEFRCAVILWCKAWHQVPASSLPNDDRLLSHLAGFGRDMKAWRAVRDVALRGFVECSAGRLYHPVIAEKAIEAADAKRRRRERTAKATAAREAKSGGRDEQRDEQRDVDRDVERNVHQGKGEGREGIGIVNSESESARTPKLLEPREATEQSHKDVARDLLQSPTAKLSDWERQFLGSIAESRSLTRHQRERFDAIVGAQQHRPSGEGSTISIDDMRKLGVRI